MIRQVVQATLIASFIWVVMLAEAVWAQTLDEWVQTQTDLVVPATRAEIEASITDAGFAGIEAYTNLLRVQAQSGQLAFMPQHEMRTRMMDALGVYDLMPLAAGPGETYDWNGGDEIDTVVLIGIPADYTITSAIGPDGSTVYTVVDGVPQRGGTLIVTNAEFVYYRGNRALMPLQ